LSAVAIPDSSSVNAVSASIDAMPFARFHAKLVATMGSAHLFDAYDATALAFVLPVLVGEWGLRPTQVGILLSAGYVGQLVGAVASGALADRFGRVLTLRAAIAVLSLFSLACALAPSYGALLILRLIQGVGLGGETPIAATYLNELSPARMRGRMVSLIQWMFAIGTIVSAVLAPLLVPKFGWQAMFVVGGAPLLLAASLRRLLPESPSWLFAKGRFLETTGALKRIGADAPKLGGPAYLMTVEMPQKTQWAGLFSEGRTRATLAAWLIGICCSIVGYGIIGWMPTLYRTVYHLPVNLALRYGMSNGAAALVGGFLGVAIIDRFSRKAYIVTGFTGCSLALGVLGLLGDSATALHAAILSGIGYTFLGMVLAGIYVYAPELYPIRMKALGMGMTSAWIRVGSIIGPPIIGLMLTVWPVQRVFFLFAFTAAIGAVGTWCIGVETRPADRAPRHRE
jgi:putative MFS transporter